jgi:hypothetical protein
MLGAGRAAAEATASKAKALKALFIVELPCIWMTRDNARAKNKFPTYRQLKL